MKKKEKKTFGCYNLRSTSSEVCFTHVPFHILSLFGFVYNLFVCCIWSELFYLIRRLLKYLSRFAHLFESPTSESINLLLEGLIFCAPGHLSSYTKTYNVRPDHSSPHFFFFWFSPPPPPPPLSPLRYVNWALEYYISKILLFLAYLSMSVVMTRFTCWFK